MDDIDQFGLTDNRMYYDGAVRFREAAIADGWIATPTYEQEEVERHATLKKDGFKIHVKARTNMGKWLYQAGVTVWGPDRMQIAVPNEYDGQSIANAVNCCNYCGKRAKTTRVGFAGRSCDECLPAQRERLEYPGWTL